MRSPLRSAALLLFALAASCAACPGPVLPDGGEPEDPDAGVTDSGALDGGSDSGTTDAGFDAGEVVSIRCPARDAGIPAGGRLRVIAANLSSGNLQTWDNGEGARILDGLDVDVALMQEWKLAANTDEGRRAWLDSTFGPGFCFQVENSALPNGVVSRWPILASGEWPDSQVFNRSFVWARIDVPGPRDLWAVSVHLLTSNAAQRNLEAQDLANAIGLEVPAGDLLVVGGDLNTNSRTETGITTLATVLRTAAPHPVDASGNSNTNATRSQPYDWVLANPDLAALQRPVAVGSANFDGGLVFDSRVFTPLSAVFPVQAGDSAAVNMQHMAVVKDFLLP